MNCPHCKRPFNDGNSPNPAECNGMDDDEGVCEAYAKIERLTRRLRWVENVVGDWEANFGPEPGDSRETRIMLSVCRTLRAALAEVE